MMAVQVFERTGFFAQPCKQGIDIRNIDCMQFYTHFFHQFAPDARQNGRVLARTVVLEGSDCQFLCQYIQFMFIELRQQNARHLQGVNRCKLLLNAQPFACRIQKGHVKSRIMRDQCATRRKREEFRHRFAQFGCTCNRFIRNAGQFGNLCRNMLMRIDIGLERVDNLPIPHQNGGNLCDFLGCRLQSRGFQVKNNHFSRKRRIAFAAHHRNPSRIVDIVRFHAIEDFEVDFIALNGVHGFWERLRDAMVGNCHRRMFPQLGALHQRLGRRHTVHSAHIGMQMQLDTLLFCLVHADMLLCFDNGGRFQNTLLFVSVIGNFTLNRDIRAGLDERHHLSALLLGKELGNPHRVGVVRDIKRNLNPLFAALF